LTTEAEKIQRRALCQGSLAPSFYCRPRNRALVNNPPAN